MNNKGTREQAALPKHLKHPRKQMRLLRSLIRMGKSSSSRLRG